MARSLKDSGVDWIGNIPFEWGMSRIGATFEHVNEKNTNREETNILSLMKDIGVIPYSEKGAVGNNASEDIERYYLVQPNDIVMNSMNVIIGSVGKSRYKGCLSQVYHVLRVRDKEEDYVDYYDYLFATRQFQRKLVGYGNGILEHRMRIPMSKLKIVDLPKPSYEVQSRIAYYLDKKVDKINELIQVQKDAITKFEEYKQQVISETINFGLEKDNLVDSKYEWIKKIPAHWEIEKVARTTYLKGRIGWQGLKSTEFKTEGPHLVTGTDFNNGYVDWDNCVRVTEQRYEEAKFIQVQEGDLLITKDGTIGKVAIAQNAPVKVSVNSGIFVTRPLHNEYINKYFYYLMLSDVFKEFFQLTLTGNSTILHLYQGVFSQFRYPLPPMEEQLEIVNYLDKKIEEIEQLIQIKKDKIEKLNDYKKSLIYEAVTGKIEVM